MTFSTTESSQNNEKLFDLIVVGAGPHALSLMAVLNETHPDPFQEHPDNSKLFYRAKEAPINHFRFNSTTSVVSFNSYPKILAKRDPRYIRPTKQNWGRLETILKKRVQSKKDVYFYNRDENQDNEHINCLKSCVPSTNSKKHRFLVLDKQSNNKEDTDTSHESYPNKKLSKWLHAWDNLFATFQIPHLRSPISHHPDAGDPMLFWYFTKFHHRMNEFFSLEIDKEDILDQDPSEHGYGREFRGPFLLPGTKLFRDFVQDAIVDRFNLDSLVKKGSVQTIIPKKGSFQNSHKREHQSEDDEHTDSHVPIRQTFGNQVTNHAFDFYDVVLEDGSILSAKNIVIAKGSSGAIRRYPEWCQSLIAKSKQVKNNDHDIPWTALVHCYDIGLNSKKYLEEVKIHFCQRPIRMNNVKHVAALEGLTIVIVGGGLTSLNLAKMAIDHGCHQVYILSRQGMRVQPFDTTHKWVGPDRNKYLARYWSTSSPQERLEQYKQAKFPNKEMREVNNRSSASVTREGLLLLHDDIKSGQVKLHEFAEITNAYWDRENLEWTMLLNNQTIMKSNLIWLATGVVYDVEEDPMFTHLVERSPIEVFDGLPALRSDLSWSKTCPGVYVMGQYAALILGPGAPNLAGGRAGAARISKTLMRRLNKSHK